MKKYILVATVLSLTLAFADGQPKKKPVSKAKYSAVFKAGILEGQAAKTYGQLQLVNGMQRGLMFYGLGVGIDYYGAKRSVPLFLNVQRNLARGPRIPFIYADGGYNISWLRESDKANSWGMSNYKQKGGAYYEAGLGYKFSVSNKMAFGLSAGYSFKQQSESYSNTFWIWEPIPSEGDLITPDVYDYKFRRICVKFNCWF